ncbi:MAG: DUF2336 domain-containing protein [Alphaproteobacteria bacterium]
MNVLAKEAAGRADGTASVIDYAEAKRLAADADPGARERLALRPDVQPEILYYLASDESPAVRRAIAGNDATPRQADALLVADSDDEVRIALARKIARLAPELKPDQLTLVQKLALDVLEQLARDQLPRVRRIIAEEVRYLDNLPRDLIKRLARDVELTVCAPVLEFSPLLNDDDLLEIIRSRPVQGALSAISRRAGIGLRVADAVVSAEDEGAVAALLGNASAQIREETLDRIVDAAPNHEIWHKPLVERDDLSHRAVTRIAKFISVSLLAVLETRYRIMPETTREVAAAIDRRLSADGMNEAGLPEHRAADLHAAGKLDEVVIAEAIQRADREFIVEALALKSGIVVERVRQVFGSFAPKAVVAVCWKAGLSMRMAQQIEIRVARIPHPEVINAKDGIDYPFSGAEMRQILRFID